MHLMCDYVYNTRTSIANAYMYTCINVEKDYCLDEDLMYLYATSNSVLQCVAVCCSVLQCVAVFCSVLQCVAVCCTTNHYLHATES